jgi:hypothetical protein
LARTAWVLSDGFGVSDWDGDAHDALGFGRHPESKADSISATATAFEICLAVTMKMVVCPLEFASFGLREERFGPSGRVR